MAATLDEAMGAVCWMNGHKVVAATITINFLSMLPIETETIVEATIDRVGRTQGAPDASKLKNPPDASSPRVSGLFIVLKTKRLKALEPS